MDVDLRSRRNYGALEAAATGSLVAVAAPELAPPQALTRAIERIASAVARKARIISRDGRASSTDAPRQGLRRSS